MPLLQLILLLMLIGVGLWAITKFIPMDPRIKQIIIAVVVIAVVIYLLQAFGVFGYVESVKVPRVDG